MLRVLPDYELLQHSAEKPIVLAGPPDALTGDVYMANPGEQHIVVRSARLRELPDPTSSEIELPMVAILRAGHGARARVTARLHPSTPPGDYKSRLVLGDFSYPAELHVIEDIDLDILPNQLIVDNQPGTRTEKQVLFRNQGNVELTIGSPEALVIDEEVMSCRILRGGLAQGTEHGAGNVDEWLTAFLREAHRNVREAGMLHVRNKEGETSVPPGESRRVDFVIRQPDTLRANSRYFSVAFFYTGNLLISIVPGEPARRVTGQGSPEEENNRAEPVQARRSGRKPRQPRSGK